MLARAAILLVAANLGAASAQTFPRALHGIPAEAHARFESSCAEITACSASVSRRDRKIRIVWRRTFEAGDWNRSTQTIDVDYWPTSVAAWGADTICVTGFSDEGTTLLEVLAFDPAPELKPAPSHAPPGRRALPQTTLAVVKRTRIDPPALAKLGPVRFAVRNLGRPNHLFLWLEQTRDLWEFDGADQSVTRVLSSTPSDDVPHVPLLANDHVRFLGGDHAELGLVYSFAESDSTHEFLVLRDIDRDGVLDPRAFDAFGPDGWSTSGLGDGDAYRSFYVSGPTDG